MPDSDVLIATEAAALLGISVPTLYDYVSRGMLSSSPDAQERHRLYDAGEVRRLARPRPKANARARSRKKC